MYVLLLAIGIFVIIMMIFYAHASTNAKQGNLVPLEYKYICGIPNLKEGELIRVSATKGDIKIKDYQYRPKFTIDKEKIISKNVIQSTTLSEKQKSVIGRSLVGFAIGGGLGAVVGGISGTGTKQTTEVTNFLDIMYTDENGIQQEAMFALLDKNLSYHVDLFVRN